MVEWEFNCIDGAQIIVNDALYCPSNPKLRVSHEKLIRNGIREVATLTYPDCIIGASPDLRFVA